MHAICRAGRGSIAPTRALCLAAALAMAAAASAGAQQQRTENDAPTPEQRARIEAVPRERGFVRWKEIGREDDGRIWEVDDAYTADGRRFDLRLSADDLRETARHAEDCPSRPAIVGFGRCRACYPPRRREQGRGHRDRITAAGAPPAAPRPHRGRRGPVRRPGGPCPCPAGRGVPPAGAACPGATAPRSPLLPPNVEGAVPTAPRRTPTCRASVRSMR